MPNNLIYGDNLLVLWEHVPDASVDLVYLDPPFTPTPPTTCCFGRRPARSRPPRIRLSPTPGSGPSKTQATYEQDIIHNPSVPSAVKDMISAFRQFISQNAMMA